MSAYLVEKHHIDFLVGYLDSHCEGWFHYIEDCKDIKDKQERLNTAGRILIQENHRSVCARYDKEEQEFRYRFERRYYDISPVQVIKSVCHLRYQSNENEDYFTTPAEKILRTIEYTAITHLPGYTEAIWGVPEPFEGKRVELSSLAGK